MQKNNNKERSGKKKETINKGNVIRFSFTFFLVTDHFKKVGSQKLGNSKRNFIFLSTTLNI